MSSNVPIHVHGLHKRFGRTEALRGVDLMLSPGDSYALLGRNGAGKTSSIRILMGLDRPTSGEARVLGEEPWTLSPETKERIGYVSESMQLYPWLDVGQIFGYVAALYTRWDSAYQRHLLERLELAPHHKLGKLSKGQQRRVALALALAPKPELLILDEPAGGLDPAVRREFLDVVIEVLSDEGKTVLFTSHILTDVERIASRVGILEQGRMLVDRPIDELKERVRKVSIDLANPAEDVAIPNAVRVTRLGPRSWTATVDDWSDERAAAIRRALPGATVEAHALGLEDVFLEYVGGRHAD